MQPRSESLEELENNNFKDNDFKDNNYHTCTLIQETWTSDFSSII